MTNEVRSLWSVLEDDDVQRERAILKIALCIAACTVALATFGTLIAPHLGGAYVILLAVVATAWFSIRLAFPRAGRVLRVISHVFVIAIPAVVIVIVHFHNSPEIAFASWIPPQLWLLVISFSALRLRPWVPAVLGVAAAATYTLVWTALILPLPGAYFTEWSAWALRTATLVTWGALAAGAARWLRSSFTRSARNLRERDLFGKYRLGPEIAKGGMGTVCRAVYCPEGGFFRDVAIKRIHPHLTDDPRAVERFRAEAELGARLHHQNIVATLDFGRAAGTYFLAMEYIDGASLRTLLRSAQGPAPARVVAHVGREVCRGLRFAHELATDGSGQPLRVVHRDLCPNNIMVSRSGHVKIADFGIARALGTDDLLEHTDHVLGKPAYLAPELVRAEPHDARVDLFSLGSVLWELITGERAFQRENQAATLYAVASADRPPLSKLRPDLDNRWVRFFERALAADAFERFATAAEMGEALAELEGRALAPDELQRWVHAVLRHGERGARAAPEVTEEVNCDHLLASNDDVSVDEDLSFEDDPVHTAETEISGPPLISSVRAA